MDESLTLPQRAITIEELMISDGSISVPSLRFASSNNTGLFRTPAGNLGFASKGIEYMSVSDAFVNMKLPMALQDQTAPVGLPISQSEGFLFKKANDDGLYWNTATGGEVNLRFAENVSFPLHANPSGTNILPAYSFANDILTGMYNSASDTISFSAGGNESLRITPNYILTMQGNAGNPGISFFANNASGIYLDTANNTLAISHTGVKRLSITQTKAAFSNVYGLQLDSGILPANISASDNSTQMLFFNTSGKLSRVNDTGAIIDIEKTVFPLLADTANVTAPSYSFNNETNTGMYLSSQQTISLSINGVKTYSFGPSAFVLDGNNNTILSANNGTISTPSYTFTTDTDTGIYRVTNNQLGITVGGSNVCTFALSSINPQIIANIGSSSEPCYTFAGKTNTGIYYNTTAGLNSSGAMALQHNGITNLLVASSSVELRTQQQNTPGNVSVPSYSFTVDNDTGIYRPSANKLAIAAGGIACLDIDVNVMKLYNGRIEFTEQLPTAASLVGSQRVFIDSNDKHLKRVDVNGSVIDIEREHVDGNFVQYKTSDINYTKDFGIFSVVNVAGDKSALFYNADLSRWEFSRVPASATISATIPTVNNYEDLQIKDLSASNITITGNLTVMGITTTTSVSTASTTNNVITLALGNIADALDMGLIVEYTKNSSTKYGGFYRDATDSEWYLYADSTTAPSSTITRGIGSALANINVANATLSGNLILNNASSTLAGLTQAELAQLANINTNTITATTWGYLANIGQAVDPSANVTFASVAVTGTLAGLTQAELAQLANINTNIITATQWGYLAATDQSVSKNSGVYFDNIIISSVASTTPLNIISNNGANNTNAHIAFQNLGYFIGYTTSGAFTAAPSFSLDCAADINSHIELNFGANGTLHLGPSAQSGLIMTSTRQTSIISADAQPFRVQNSAQITALSLDLGGTYGAAATLTLGGTGAQSEATCGANFITNATGTATIDFINGNANANAGASSGSIKYLHTTTTPNTDELIFNCASARVLTLKQNKAIFGATDPIGVVNIHGLDAGDTGTSAGTPLLHIDKYGDVPNTVEFGIRRLTASNTLANSTAIALHSQNQPIIISNENINTTASLSTACAIFNTDLSTDMYGPLTITQANTTKQLRLGYNAATYADLHVDNNGTLKFAPSSNIAYILGSFGIGTSTPDRRLEILAASRQLRLTYTDAIDYLDIACISDKVLMETQHGTILSIDNITNQNTALGTNALNARVVNSATANTALGYNAASAITLGDNNTIIGANTAASLTTGSNNTIIGTSSRTANPTDINSIVLGSNVVGNGSNTATYGDSNMTKHIFIGDMFFGASASLSSINSQVLIKNNTQNYTAGANAQEITALRLERAGGSITYATNPADIVQGNIADFALARWSTSGDTAALDDQTVQTLNSYTRLQLNLLDGATTTALNKGIMTWLSSGDVIVGYPDYTSGAFTPARFNIHATTDQLRLFYSPSVYSSLFCDSSGNLSINTNTLIVNTAHINNSIELETAGPAGFQIKSTGFIAISGYASNTYTTPSPITFKLLNKSGVDEIVFTTSDKGSASVDTTVISYINTAGKFGIGTNAPQTRLDVMADVDQLRLSYSQSIYAGLSVDLNGDLTIGLSKTTATYIFLQTISKIGTQTFTPTTWGYLANIGQAVDPSANVTFATINTTNISATNINATSTTLSGALSAASATISGNLSLSGNLILNNASSTLAGLTQAELTQLANINTNTITATTWGYLANIGQAVDPSANVTFATINTTNISATNINATDINATSTTLSGALSALSATLSGNLSCGYHLLTNYGTYSQHQVERQLIINGSLNTASDVDLILLDNLGNTNILLTSTTANTSYIASKVAIGTTTTAYQLGIAAGVNGLNVQQNIPDLSTILYGGYSSIKGVGWYLQHANNRSGQTYNTGFIGFNSRLNNTGGIDFLTDGSNAVGFGVRSTNAALQLYTYNAATTVDIATDVSGIQPAISIDSATHICTFVGIQSTSAPVPMQNIRSSTFSYTNEAYTLYQTDSRIGYFLNASALYKAASTRAGIDTGFNVFLNTTTANKHVLFGTNSIERMHINDSYVQFNSDLHFALPNTAPTTTPYAPTSYSSITQTAGDLSITSYNSLRLYANNGANNHGVYLDSNTIRPVLDASLTLGSATFRWGTIYSTSGVINTSDRNIKKNIVSSDLGLDFIMALKPVSYKFRDYTSKNGIHVKHSRVHYGFISQDVGDILQNFDKTPKDFAGFTYDQVDGREIYGLRYMEFIAPIVRAIQQLNEFVADNTTNTSANDSTVTNGQYLDIGYGYTGCNTGLGIYSGMEISSGIYHNDINNCMEINTTNPSLRINIKDTECLNVTESITVINGQTRLYNSQKYTATGIVDVFVDCKISFLLSQRLERGVTFTELYMGSTGNGLYIFEISIDNGATYTTYTIDKSLTDSFECFPIDIKASRGDMLRIRVKSPFGNEQILLYLSGEY